MIPCCRTAAAGRRFLRGVPFQSSLPTTIPCRGTTALGGAQLTIKARTTPNGPFSHEVDPPSPRRQHLAALLSAAAPASLGRPPDKPGWPSRRRLARLYQETP